MLSQLHIFMSIHYLTFDLISHEVNKGNKKTKLPNSEQRESQNRNGPVLGEVNDIV